MCLRANPTGRSVRSRNEGTGRGLHAVFVQVVKLIEGQKYMIDVRFGLGNFIT